MFLKPPSINRMCLKGRFEGIWLPYLDCFAGMKVNRVRSQLRNGLFQRIGFEEQLLQRTANIEFH